MPVDFENCENIEGNSICLQSKGTRGCVTVADPPWTYTMCLAGVGTRETGENTTHLFDAFVETVILSGIPSPTNGE